MGQRGIQPAPTAIKLLKGEQKSRINKREPQPTVASGEPPKPPTWLDPAARRVWRRIAGDMWAKGVLTDWDGEAFAVLCAAIVHHRRACEHIAKTDILVKGDGGRVVKNPALQVARDAGATIRSLAPAFGMTPGGRSGIELPPTADLQEARRLLA